MKAKQWNLWRKNNRLSSTAKVTRANSTVWRFHLYADSDGNNIFSHRPHLLHELYQHGLRLVKFLHWCSLCSTALWYWKIIERYQWYMQWFCTLDHNILHINIERYLWYMQWFCTLDHNILHINTLHSSSSSRITLNYIKSYLECPKSLRTARTLYEIEGVMWEYSYVGKHLEKR